METKIFYYSTTGNSLALARNIADGLGGAELISIPKVMKGQVDVKAERLGFVFPVYRWGLPPIVAEFVKGLKLQRNQYVFAVLTAGKTPGTTLPELRSILRKAGADLNAGFVTRASSNSVADLPDIVQKMNNLPCKIYQTGKERLPEILDAIKSKKEHKLETSAFISDRILGLMHGFTLKAADQLKETDRDFSTDNKCKSCHTCEKICPRENIKFVENKPVWNHKCECCNACIQWCPQQAIHFKDENNRYRNPEIKLEDLLLR